MKPYLDYQQINPRSELLKKVIKLYYVQRAEHELTHERIIYFPNYVIPLITSLFLLHLGLHSKTC